MFSTRKISLFLFFFGILVFQQGCLVGLPQTTHSNGVVEGGSVEVDANDTGQTTGELKIVWDSLDVCGDEQERWQIKIRRKKFGKWELSRQETVDCNKDEWLGLSLAPGLLQVDIRRASDITGRPILLQSLTIQAGKQSLLTLSP